MSLPKRHVWLNGELWSNDQDGLNDKAWQPSRAGVSCLDQGLLRGWGVFETMLAVGERLPLWSGHWRRLQSGLQALAIPTISEQQLTTWLSAALRSACRTESTQPTFSRVRLTVTAGDPYATGFAGGGGEGEAKLDLPWWVPGRQPTVIIETQETGPPKPWHQQPGLRLLTYPTAWQVPPMLHGYKHTSYLPWLMAARYAAERDCDDAVLVSAENEVIETSRSNLFGWSDERLWTPPLSSGCLPGVMRATVIETASRLGIPVHEEPLGCQALAAMQQVFATSATTGIQRIQYWETIEFQTPATDQLSQLAAEVFQRIHSG